MTYKRVLPRDLFNEANLLKCLGQLTLLIEDNMLQGVLYHYDGDVFRIEQSDADGSIRCTNIEFWLAGHAKINMVRPLNSRAPWPLLAEIGDNVYEVFDANGKISAEFKRLVDGRESRPRKKPHAAHLPIIDQLAGTPHARQPKRKD